MFPGAEFTNRPKKTGVKDVILELLPMLLSQGLAGAFGGWEGAGAATKSFQSMQELQRQAKREKERDELDRQIAGSQIEDRKEGNRISWKNANTAARNATTSERATQSVIDDRELENKPHYVDEKGNLSDRLPQVPLPGGVAGLRKTGMRTQPMGETKMPFPVFSQEMPTGVKVGPQLPLKDARLEAANVRSENRQAANAAALATAKERSDLIEVAKAFSDANPEAAREVLGRLGIDIKSELKAKSTGGAEGKQYVNAPNGSFIIDRQNDRVLKQDKDGTFKPTTEVPQNTPMTVQNIISGQRGFQNEATLRDDYRQDTAADFVRVAAYSDIKQAMKDHTGASDVGLVYGFIKMQDPNAVREGELALAESAGRSIPQYLIQLFQKVKGGQRLTPQQRAEMADLADKFYNGSIEPRIKAANSRYEGIAKSSGLNPANIIKTPAFGGSDSDIAIGTIAVNPQTGEKLKWNGSAWVP